MNTDKDERLITAWDVVIGLALVIGMHFVVQFLSR